MVHKYIDAKGGIESLKNKTIQFNKASSTNDPFECYEGLIDIEDINEYAKHLLKLRYGNPTIRQLRKQVPVIVANYKKYGTEEVFERQRKNINIASFSKRNDSSLMWSYYADSHKGISIGYLIEGYLQFGNISATFLAVNYMKEIEMIYYKPNNYKSLLTWASTKSYDWNHEEEVRLLYISEEEEFKTRLNYPTKILKKITFGLNTSEEDINHILKIIDSEYSNNDIEVKELVIGKEIFTVEEIPFER